MSTYPQILGIYSMEKKADVGGTGGKTLGRYQQKTFWFVRRTDDDEYEIQPLNSNHVPSGVKSTLSGEEFIKSYVPEPGYYETNTVPALKTLGKKLEKGEELFKEGNLDEAEREFAKALMIDDVNVEANMGLGSVHCEKKEFQKVKKVLNILLNSDATFQEGQRKQFNTFGISLRKQGLLEEARQYYGKALEFNDRDEHLHFNMARVYFTEGENETCLKHLKTALELDPKFEEAKKFLNYCQKKSSPGKEDASGETPPSEENKAGEEAAPPEENKAPEKTPQPQTE
ncbi:MAG: hypothetical protein SVS15_04215 [Thermodesulfobacteriota bacterium]|nr:hypothetical protein [Thermodesulfobacteriota bacterium]